MTQIASALSDHGALLSLPKLPLRLSEPDRIERFDRPLAQLLAARGIGRFLRGFSPIGSDGEVMYVGLEISLEAPRGPAEFAACLLNLGAPRDSRIEYENDAAAVEFSLAEVTRK